MTGKQAQFPAVIVGGWNDKSFRRCLKRFGVVLFILALLFSTATERSVSAQHVISDDSPLALPNVGDYELRILSPNILELTLINTKAPDPGRVSAWDFVGNNYASNLPSASEFLVTKDGKQVGVTAVGFKRRVLSAPEKPDLRIANTIYLQLGGTIAEGQTVEVKNPSGKLWTAPVNYTAMMAPLRYSPALHVNQLGYMPNYPKKAMVGYYLGSLGELVIPLESSFELVESQTQLPVYSGPLTVRKDVGFSYSKTPYQQVYEADFSGFTTPGEYQLVVPGFGSSFPFRIDGGVTAAFARTLSLGLYHQRCGTDNSLPYTRHTHGRCHYLPAEVPTMDPQYASTQQVLAEVTDVRNDSQTATVLNNVAASLFPFVKQGTIDVSGGHHDAGDYSKYTINSAGLVHFLVFAADSFPGVGALDNLGLPESGDGKSDVLQEAKWEADFLAKMQDSDGGFYFLVYPKTRRYENNVLPDQGDSQVVWPKTTAVTAAAVGALAEAGSSPLMKAQFPVEAANYLAKAKLGWNFLMNAIARYGKNGSYQKITHYGNEFMHDDELAWAAAAMYAATGEAQYKTKLFEFFPDPNSENTRRWTWWRLFEGYGCAVRTYAFAARSGRLPAAKLDAAYLAKCEAEILAAADDHTRFSRQSAYGTSFPDVTKQNPPPGWYFSSERAFDVTAAYQLQARPEYRETVVANFNYEGGCNPLNMPFVTGIGYKRQREVVSQYAWNDRRILPPAGLPQGNIRFGYGYLEAYFTPGTSHSELPGLSFPSDFTSSGPYPYYDRWTDMIDTTTEFVVMDMARSLASLSFWMAQGDAATQTWKPILGQISGLEAPIQAGSSSTLTLTAPGIGLSNAQVLWEVRFLEPQFGNPAAITPRFSGDHWIEAEAILPDGRRIVAASNFIATAGLDIPPNRFQSSEVIPGADTVALYHADGTLVDATGRNPSLALEGNARLDTSNLAWMSQRNGGALRFLDLNDRATVKIPTSLLKSASTSEIVLEGMVYVNEFKAYARDVAKIFSLSESYNDSYLEFREDKYMGPFLLGGNVFSFSGAALNNVFTKKEWHHMSISISRTGYTFKLDGVVQATLASNELGNWGRASTATLTLGNFDGWIDEIVIRSVGASFPPVTGSSGTAATLTSVGTSAAGFRMQVSGKTGTTYLVQASENGILWTNLQTVTLSGSTAEFLDSSAGSQHRFYRAVVQNP